MHHGAESGGCSWEGPGAAVLETEGIPPPKSSQHSCPSGRWDWGLPASPAPLPCSYHCSKGFPVSHHEQLVTRDGVNERLGFLSAVFRTAQKLPPLVLHLLRPRGSSPNSACRPLPRWPCPGSHLAGGYSLLSVLPERPQGLTTEP